MMMKNTYLRIACTTLIACLIIALCWWAVKYCPILITALGIWLLCMVAAGVILSLYAWALGQSLVKVVGMVFDDAVGVDDVIG